MSWFDHCMIILVGSNPCRRLSLLGVAHPVAAQYILHDAEWNLYNHFLEEHKLHKAKKIDTKLTSSENCKGRYYTVLMSKVLEDDRTHLQ